MAERPVTKRLLDIIRRRRTKTQTPDIAGVTPGIPDNTPTVVMQRVIGNDPEKTVPLNLGSNSDAITTVLNLGGVDPTVVFPRITDDTVVIHVGNIGEEAFDTAMIRAEEEMRRVQKMTKDELDKAITEGNLFARFEQARQADRTALVPTAARTRQQDNKTTTEDREEIITLLTQKAMDGYLAVTIAKRPDILTKDIDPDNLEAVFVSIGAHLGRFRRDKETLANLLLSLFNNPDFITPTWRALVDARSSKEFEKLLPIKLAEHLEKMKKK